MQPDQLIERFAFVLSGTGASRLHRSKQKHIKDVWKWVYRELKGLKAEHGEDEVLIISGMAQGFDTVLASVAQHTRTPWIAAVPSPTYGDYYWHRNSVTGMSELKLFEKYIDNATLVHYVCDSHLWGQANFKRNEWMVKRADKFLVYQPGNSSGTAHAVNLLEEHDVPYTEYKFEDETS